MTTVMPQGELMRKAVAHVSEGLAEGKNLGGLLDDAAMRFNLSPKDCEFLKKFFAKTEAATK